MHRFGGFSDMTEFAKITPVAPDAPAVAVTAPSGGLPDKPTLAVVTPVAPPVTIITKITPIPVANFLDRWAAPEWRIAHLLWSVRIAIGWAIFGGLWTALPAFQSYLPPFWFGLTCVFFSLAILFAKFTNQPGLPEL
jgi:hypothetical protein